MPFDQFEQLIKYLARHFEIVSVQDIFKSHSNSKKRIALTFDDGYVNNYTQVFPVIKQYKVPATFYITTECFEISDYCLWPELFDALKIGDVPQKVLFNGERFHFRNNTLVQERNGISIYEYVKNMGAERQGAFSEFINTYRIKERLKTIDPELRSFCSKEQIMEMAECELVEIGSHTHRHYNLSRVSPELMQEELSTSKRILESITGKNIVSIGFPDGDYSMNVLTEAEKAGYHYQLAVSLYKPEDSQDVRLRSRYSISNSTSLAVNKILINQHFQKSGF